MADHTTRNIRDGEWAADAIRHRAIFESAVDFAIIATDRDGLVTDWNVGAERILGWQAAEMRGEPVDRFFTPEDRAAGRPDEEMRKALENGRANDERWHMRQDGSRFWASGEMMPLRDPDGAHLGYLKILRDRTEPRRTAEALTLNRERLEAALDTGLIAFFDWDVPAGEIHGDERFAAFYGLEPEQVAAGVELSRIQATLHPDDKAAIAAKVFSARRTCADFTSELRVIHPGGQVRWLLVRARCYVQDDGKPLRYAGSAVDIGATKSAEAARLADQARQAALLELGDRLRRIDGADAMASVAVEIIGRTLQCARTGYGVVDPVRELLTIEQEWTTPGGIRITGDHPLRGFGSYVAQLKRGRSFVLHDANGDAAATVNVAGLAAVDTRAFVDVPVMEQGVLVAMFYASHNRPRQWLPEEVDFLREVADRTQSAIGRLRAENRLRVLAASLERQVSEQAADRNRLWQLSTDIMLVTRPDGRILSVNPAWTTVLGWQAPDLIGHNLTDLAHPEDLNRSVAAAWSADGGATLQRFDSRYRHKDGGYRWIAWTAAPGGGLINAVGRDVTAEKEQAAALAQAEERLRQSHKMEAVGQLTGGLAHDFNNLLTGITGSLELMQTRLSQGRAAEIGRYIATAQVAAARAAALTHRLLAFSRRQTLDPKPLDTNQLIAGMEELLQQTVGPAVTLQVSGEPALWTTLVDPNQLENVLLNLCINARDAMPDGGTLHIGTANQTLDAAAARERDLPPGHYVVLSVTDTGTGMTPEVAARAFDPFFTTKPLGQGTGLGLSMIYGFARQSGGQVHITSQPGAGTTIALSLPRHAAGGSDAPLVGATPSPSETPRGARNETVLVVDDEASVRMLVAEVLDDLGYHVVEAENGAAAMRVLNSADRVDLLVTDVGLPAGMNGRQLADAARAVRPGLRVLFITGYAESAALGDGTGTGTLPSGMQVMTKPFTLETLTGRIQALVAG